MAKFNRRNRKYRNDYYYRKKPGQGFSWQKLGIIAVVALLFLEFVCWLFFAFGGKPEEESSIISFYRPQFLSEALTPIDGLPRTGKLLMPRDTTLGYDVRGNQKSSHWQINPQGFRHQNSLSTEKPIEESRIFILGNSTTFGYWLQNNQQTISHFMSVELQKKLAHQKQNPERYRPDIFPFYGPDRLKAFSFPPKILDKKYQVINAGVPGYNSGNELALLAKKVFPYKPDAIVILDGYNDLLLSSKKNAVDIPKIDIFLNDAFAHWWSSMELNIQNNINNINIVKLWKLWGKKPLSIDMKTQALIPTENSLKESLPSSDKELQMRVDRTYKNHQNIATICAKSGIPLIIALQPEITGDNPSKLTTDEKNIQQQLGVDYGKKVDKYYSLLYSRDQNLSKSFPNLVKVINLYKFYENFPPTAFVDPIHLTKEGNQKLAEELTQYLIDFQKLQFIPLNFILRN